MREEPGAYVLAEKLFFLLCDGSTIACDCIGEPYASKVAEACANQGREPMSLGEDRVRIKFNPSDNSLVSQIKQKAAELIDICNEARGEVPTNPSDAEIARCWALAMTDFENGAMWAVKAATGEKS